MSFKNYMIFPFLFCISRWLTEWIAANIFSSIILLIIVFLNFVEQLVHIAECLGDTKKDPEQAYPQ